MLRGLARSTSMWRVTFAVGVLRSSETTSAPAASRLFGDGMADSGRGTGDHEALSFEVSHRFS